LKGGPVVDSAAQLDELLAIAEKMGIIVRAEPLGGEGGGLCQLRGRSILFVDTAADLATRYRRTLEALADWPGLDEQFLRPDTRDAIDQIRTGG
jgi:hypothetical protein